MIRVGGGSEHIFVLIGMPHQDGLFTPGAWNRAPAP